MLTQLCCNNEGMPMTARPAKEPVAVPPEIQTRLEAAGLRRTLATRAVLGLFLANPQGTLSHAQALTSLQARGLEINRVTLYRLLDRLAACGVLHRHADDGARTWRDGLADASEGSVPRYECDAGPRPVRRPEASAPTQAGASDLVRTLAGYGAFYERDAPWRDRPVQWDAERSRFLEPRRESVFSLFGGCMMGPCYDELSRYAVRVERDKVFVDLSTRFTNYWAWRSHQPMPAWAAAWP